MKNFKNIKGITLIALVVTIIILLILAGVTIGVAINGNGLFEKAKLAADKHNNAAQQEETEINKYTNLVNSYVSGDRNFSPINYSTYEQDTGLKWTDGKTIFQKTIKGTTPSQMKVTTEMFTLNDVSQNIEHVVNYYGNIYIDEDKWYVPLNFYGGDNAYIVTQIDQNKFKMYTSWFTNRNYEVTIQYTKTAE